MKKVGIFYGRLVHVYYDSLVYFVVIGHLVLGYAKKNLATPDPKFKM
jgi:hypothetical protein